MFKLQIKYENEVKHITSILKLLTWYIFLILLNFKKLFDYFQFFLNKFEFYRLTQFFVDILYLFLFHIICNVTTKNC